MKRRIEKFKFEEIYLWIIGRIDKKSVDQLNVTDYVNTPLKSQFKFYT